MGAGDGLCPVRRREARPVAERSREQVLFVVQADAEGSVSLPPVTGLGVPFPYFVQAGFVDPNTASGWTLTNAIQLDFLP